jgi:hypothetical protein
MRLILAFATLAAFAASATAAVTKTTTHDTSSSGLNGQIAVGDAISGLIATELTGDQGWHPANNAPADRLPAFTDDAGILGTGLTGLLNDWNPPVTPVGLPVKRVQYDLASPTSIGEIRVLTGNNGGDGRIYSTFAVYTSTNNGGAFNLLGYIESDPLGSINNSGSNPQLRSTMVKVFDDASPVLAADVTNIQFDFYAVDNTGGQYRDPFNGVNPFTNIDDNLSAAFVSPLVFEIDVIAIPEPASALLVLMGVVGMAYLRKR